VKITLAVMGPPPTNDDYKTRLIDGSRSPRCQELTLFWSASLQVSRRMWARILKGPRPMIDLQTGREGQNLTLADQQSNPQVSG
jgi:hypothetical protein